MEEKDDGPETRGPARTPSGGSFPGHKSGPESLTISGRPARGEERLYVDESAGGVVEFPGRGGFAAEAQFRRFFFRGSRELGESLAEWRERRCSGILRAGRTLRRVLLSRIHGSFPGGGRVWAGWGHDDAVLGEAVSAGESGQASSMEAAQAGGARRAGRACF